MRGLLLAHLLSQFQDRRSRKRLKKKSRQERKVTISLFCQTFQRILCLFRCIRVSQGICPKTLKTNKRRRSTTLIRLVAVIYDHREHTLNRCNRVAGWLLNLSRLKNMDLRMLSSPIAISINNSSLNTEAKHSFSHLVQLSTTNILPLTKSSYSICKPWDSQMQRISSTFKTLKTCLTKIVASKLNSSCTTSSKDCRSPSIKANNRPILNVTQAKVLQSNRAAVTLPAIRAHLTQARWKRQSQTLFKPLVSSRTSTIDASS